MAAGGVSGFVLALRSEGGAVAHAGFGALAVAWAFTTFRAFERARAADYPTHRRLMVRSYALTFAAVTLRIYIPVTTAVGFPFETAYPAIAWLCWVPNLAAANRWFVPRRGRFS